LLPFPFSRRGTPRSVCHLPPSPPFLFPSPAPTAEVTKRDREKIRGISLGFLFFFPFFAHRTMWLDQQLSPDKLDFFFLFFVFPLFPREVQPDADLPRRESRFFLPLGAALDGCGTCCAPLFPPLTLFSRSKSPITASE